MDYSEIKSEQALEQAMACARGSYQRDVLLGCEALSGATLKGAARSYGGKYAASRRALLARMTAAGVPWHEERRAHGKRVLVIG